MPPAPRLLNPARLPGEGPSETPQRDLREGDVPFSPHSWPGPHTLGSARGRGAASERRLAVGSGVGFGICACAWVREPPGTTERGKGRPGAGAVAEDGRRGRTGRGCARGPPPRCPHSLPARSARSHAGWKGTTGGQVCPSHTSTPAPLLQMFPSPHPHASRNSYSPVCREKGNVRELFSEKDGGYSSLSEAPQARGKLPE